MKQKLAINLLAAGFIVGLGAGWFIGSVRMQRAVDHERTEDLELFLMSQGESTTWSYFDETPAFAAGALHTYLTEVTDYVSHDSFMDPRYMTFQLRSHLMDLAVAHGRLAKLYQSLGKLERSSNHVATAIGLVGRVTPEADWTPPIITNQASLFQLVEELDGTGNPYGPL